MSDAIIIAEIRTYLLGRYSFEADDLTRRLNIFVAENTTELAQLRAENAEMREALKPFAKIGEIAKRRGVKSFSEFLFFTSEDDGVSFRYNDAYRATAVLAKYPEVKK